MHVLILVPSISRIGGGVSEATRLLAVALSADPTITVEVMTLRDEFTDEAIDEWPPIRISAYRTFGPARFGFSPGLLRAVVASPAEIVHVHGIWMFHCLAAYIWAMRTGRPYIVTPHGMMERWIRARSPKLKAAISWLYQSRFLRRAAAFHILTEKERDDVTDMVPDALTAIVPNYVAPAVDVTGRPGWWQPPAHEGRDIYLFFGRIHEKKGCIELCNAFAALCEEEPRFAETAALVFCGWLDSSEAFPETVNALASKGYSIQYVGPQFGLDKIKTLNAANFVVLPSKSEGLPMVILEAFASGKPVLMTAECNIPAAFPAGAAMEIGSDEAAIRQGLAIASAMPAAERAAMSRSALRFVADHYSEAAVREGMLAVYRTALSGKGSA